MILLVFLTVAPDFIPPCTRPEYWARRHSSELRFAEIVIVNAERLKRRRAVMSVRVIRRSSRAPVHSHDVVLPLGIQSCAPVVGRVDKEKKSRALDLSIRDLDGD